MISTRSSKKIKSLKKYFIITLISAGLHYPAFPQKKIEFEFKNTSLKEALIKLIDEYNISLIFKDSIPDNYINSICIRCDDEDAVSEILKNTNLSWIKSDDQYIIYKSKNTPKF